MSAMQAPTPLPVAAPHPNDRVYEDNNDDIHEGFNKYTNFKEVVPCSLSSDLFGRLIDPLTPFIATSLQKIHGAIFGSDRAVRSTDVAIYNQTEHDFEYTNNSHKDGGWTAGLMPEWNIPPKMAVVYGCESCNFMTGCNDNMVEYTCKNCKCFFQVSTSNPYIGENGAESRNNAGPLYRTSTLKIYTIVSTGYNNKVKFNIRDNYGPDL